MPESNDSFSWVAGTVAVIPVFMAIVLILFDAALQQYRRFQRSQSSGSELLRKIWKWIVDFINE